VCKGKITTDVDRRMDADAETDDEFELDDILESALDDLDEQEKEAAESQAVKATCVAQKPSVNDSSVVKPVFGPEPPPEMPSDVPMDLDETMKEFMKELENGDLKQMMEEANQSPEFNLLMDALTKLEPPSGAAVAGDSGTEQSSASQDEALADDSIDSTLRMLQEAMEQVEKDRASQGGTDGMGLPDMSAEEMDQMKSLLGNLGENTDFQEYLDKILQQMMSKEVLEAPMKQIDEKYKVSKCFVI